MMVSPHSTAVAAGLLNESVRSAFCCRVPNKPADLLLRNGRIINVFSGEIETADIAIYDGKIAGIGTGYSAKQTIDLNGSYVSPGLIDAHVHIESSLCVPAPLNRRRHVVAASCHRHHRSPRNRQRRRHRRNPLHGRQPPRHPTANRNHGPQLRPRHQHGHERRNAERRRSRRSSRRRRCRRMD